MNSENKRDSACIQALQKAVHIKRSQSQLAMDSGLSQAMISKVLAKKGKLSEASAMAIARATNNKVSVRELMPASDWDIVNSEAP